MYNLEYLEQISGHHKMNEKAHSAHLNTDWKTLHQGIRDKMKTEFLQEAMRTRERWLLEKAIEVAKEAPSIVLDDPVLTEAETELEIVSLRDDLHKARDEKDPELIKAVLRRIPGSERYMSRLQHDVAEANSDLARFYRMAQLRRSILDMDMKTMSEIRRYHKPPPKIHDVMKAAMLLFGQDEETTTDWRIIQRQLNPHGQQGMNRRVLNFDSGAVHPAIAARVRQILEDLDVVKVQALSPGAGTFYVWAMGIVEVIESHNDKREHAATVWRQKEIFGSLVDNPYASPRSRRKHVPLCHRPGWQK